MKALERAIEILGGQSSLAASLHVKQGHVWHWLRKSKEVPAERVIPIYRATKGKVTPNDLRPDLYPDPSWLPPLVAEDHEDVA